MTEHITDKMVEAAIAAFRKAEGKDAMRLALAAAFRAAWRPIEEAKKGKEYLLFEPDTPCGRSILKARKVVERWPTHYPRKASHFMPLPPDPTEAE